MSYIDKIQAGESNVLWLGRPIYWAKTADTTTGSKHIPITQASIPRHILAARKMPGSTIYTKQAVPAFWQAT